MRLDLGGNLAGAHLMPPASVCFWATTTSSMVIRDVCLRTEAKLVSTSDMGAKDAGPRATLVKKATLARGGFMLMVARLVAGEPR